MYLDDLNLAGYFGNKNKEPVVFGPSALERVLFGRRPLKVRLYPRLS